MMNGNIEITVNGKKLTLNHISRHASEAQYIEIQALFKLYPHLTIHNLTRCLADFNKEVRLNLWLKQLHKRHNSLLSPEVKDGMYLISSWDRILNEFHDYLTMEAVSHVFNNEGAPCKEFSLVKMYERLHGKDNDKNELAIRLIELKLNYMFLYCNRIAGTQVTYQIVGNNDLEKLTPLALIGLNKISIRVYYLSILIEKTLDLADFVINGKSTDHKKGKWDNKLKDLSQFLNISEEEKRTLLNFKNSYRTSELHKLSRVRSMTAKNEWNHLQKEECLIENVLRNLFKKVTQSL